MHRVAGERWELMEVKGGTPLWLKHSFRGETYVVVVTDLARVWLEMCGGDEVAARHQKQNPGLHFDSSEATVARLGQRLTPAHVDELHQEFDGENIGHDSHRGSSNAPGADEARPLLLRLCHALGKGTAQFRWVFRLEPLPMAQSAQFIKSSLLVPFFAVTAELSRQYAALYATVQRKDAELASLARRGHKADRSLRTGPVGSLDFGEFVQSSWSGDVENSGMTDVTQWLLTQCTPGAERASSSSRAGSGADGARPLVSFSQHSNLDDGNRSGGGGGDAADVSQASLQNESQFTQHSVIQQSQPGPPLRLGHDVATGGGGNNSSAPPPSSLSLSLPPSQSPQPPSSPITRAPASSGSAPSSSPAAPIEPKKKKQKKFNSRKSAFV